ncbi:MAG TPA: hypothetical protein VKU44_05830, partial [Terriglobia bacterium]|nr:hypothetical protein [Terriglobia bacterium]
MATPTLTPPLPDEKTWEEQGGRGVIPNRPTVESDNWSTGKKIGHGLARAFFGLDSVLFPGETRRLAEEREAQQLFDRNQPALQNEANWQEYQREEAARGANIGQAIEQQQLVMPPAKREFLGQFATEVQSGMADPHQLFNKYLAMGRYIPGGVTAEDLNGVMNNTPTKPPVFSVKDKTIEPLQWKGQVYGTEPTPDEPP